MNLQDAYIELNQSLDNLWLEKRKEMSDRMLKIPANELWKSELWNETAIFDEYILSLKDKINEIRQKI